MIRNAYKHVGRQNYSSPSSAARKLDVRRGYLPVYVGENKVKSRFVIPISYLKHPLFQELLRWSEEEYGFDHPMGGITIPCSEHAFLDCLNQLSLSRKCNLH
ncbi:UNVERIFIED_CONTAM: Indole-3-acetic acid-induced protein ARG7 [Sesamum radiatum]|uniref:Indole-3-acetic acid-induced protein ARG7 n=1 Tax=Sesamum radiatum TaxID=300843 RepID=A0AAW2UB65_SESRA